MYLYLSLALTVCAGIGFGILGTTLVMLPKLKREKRKKPLNKQPKIPKLFGKSDSEAQKELRDHEVNQ